MGNSDLLIVVYNLSLDMQVRALLASAEYLFPELGCLKQKLKGKPELCQSM